MIDPRFDEVKIIVLMEAPAQVYVSRSCSSQEEAKWNFLITFRHGKIKVFQLRGSKIACPIS